MLNVVVATHSRPVPRMLVSFILMFALNVIRFIQASKKCWILLVELTSFAVNTACRNDLKRYARTHQNALSGRFFITALLILAPQLCHSQNDFNDACVSTHFDNKASVDYVIDGDTVVLDDKRHIRLIGINTPEISHNDTASEPGALRARDALKQILGGHPFIHLVYGKERLDRHGRTLAHLHLANGSNVQTQLLQSGLAMPLRIPPNVSLADCYNVASQNARNNNRGLWALARYKTHDVSSLSGTETGFYFISGRVRRVSKSRTAFWINLDNNVALRISNDDLNYFNRTPLTRLEGKNIEANGWLYKHKGQLRMRIRHPLDLMVNKS